MVRFQFTKWAVGTAGQGHAPVKIDATVEEVSEDVRICAVNSKESFGYGDASFDAWNVSTRETLRER